MVTEQAVLDVRDGEEPAFEAAFGTARTLIAAMPGFQALRLLRCLERPNRYLLLVEWATLEDHTVGFRGSAEYQEWKRLLHQFYDPLPTVEHFSPVIDSRVARS